MPSDPWLEVVPPPSPRAAAVVSFPGHVIVAADVERRWVESWLTDGDLSGPLKPVFLGALEERLRLVVNNTDVVLMAPPADGDPPLSFTPVTGDDHPRVTRARRHRSDVCAWAVDGGLVVIGRGLGGRWEAAVEVTESARNTGLGRALAGAVRHLVPEPGRPVWVQIAPGNAASLRAFLAAGYEPVGAEALLVAPMMPTFPGV
jgi:hypothetical protein